MAQHSLWRNQIAESEKQRPTILYWSKQMNDKQKNTT